MPEALAAYVQAGLEAERASAFAEAAQHFERALEIWDLVDDAERTLRARAGGGRGPRRAATRSSPATSPRGRARAQGAGARRRHRRRRRAGARP